jgi:NAD(P)-dependent dehydrogenase (short-subunit alcohol dehydrogenase family)
MAASPRPVWFITGASRGIGLELTRQLLAVEDEAQRVTVVAAVRKPQASPELQALQQKHGADSLHLLQLDVGDEASIKACEVRVHYLSHAY